MTIPTKPALRLPERRMSLGYRNDAMGVSKAAAKVAAVREPRHIDLIRNALRHLVAASSEPIALHLAELGYALDHYAVSKRLSDMHTHRGLIVPTGEVAPTGRGGDGTVYRLATDAEHEAFLRDGPQRFSRKEAKATAPADHQQDHQQGGGHDH